MIDVKEYVKDKSVGFYFTAGIALLSLVIAIVYACSYAGTDNISWAAFALLLAGIVGTAALVALKQYQWAPIAQAVLNFVALLLFIYGIYYYVSVVMTGIDATGFEPAFWANTILFAIVFVLSVVNVFLPQKKTADGDNARGENR